MINIPIADKDFKGVRHRISGRSIREDIGLYNKIFRACIVDKKEACFRKGLI